MPVAGAGKHAEILQGQKDSKSPSPWLFFSCFHLHLEKKGKKIPLNVGFTARLPQDLWLHVLIAACW